MLHELKSKYKNLAGTQPGYDCFKNAVHNTCLAIHAKILPVDIYSVKTPVGLHAYLVDGTNAYSYGLTWPTDFYPELTTPTILKLGGVERTNILLMQALNVVEDVYGYHRVLDKVSDSIPGVRTSLERYFRI